MKKLLKSEICRSVNSALNPHMVVNGLKSQTFQLKKKQRQKCKRVWKAQNALPKHTLIPQRNS